MENLEEKAAGILRRLEALATKIDATMRSAAAARYGVAEIGRVYGNQDVKMGLNNEYLVEIEMLGVTVGAKPHGDGDVECRIIKKCGDVVAKAEPHEHRVFKALWKLLN